jgi:hypothetical protein
MSRCSKQLNASGTSLVLFLLFLSPFLLFPLIAIAPSLTTAFRMYASIALPNHFPTPLATSFQNASSPACLVRSSSICLTPIYSFMYLSTLVSLLSKTQSTFILSFLLCPASRSQSFLVLFNFSASPTFLSIASASKRCTIRLFHSHTSARRRVIISPVTVCVPVLTDCRVELLRVDHASWSFR